MTPINLKRMNSSDPYEAKEARELAETWRKAKQLGRPVPMETEEGYTRIVYPDGHYEFVKEG